MGDTHLPYLINSGKQSDNAKQNAQQREELIISNNSGQSKASEQGEGRGRAVLAQQTMYCGPAALLQAHNCAQANSQAADASSIRAGKKVLVAWPPTSAPRGVQWYKLQHAGVL